MKTFLPALALLALPLTAVLVPSPAARAQDASPALAQDAKQQDLEERVAALEADLAAEKRRHDETRELLEKTLKYLDEQSQAAQKLMGVLAESEQQGFAVGENWRSRETLLAGFRAYWGAKSANLPAPPKPAPAQKPAVSQRPARK